MPNLRNGTKGGFEQGLTLLRVWHSTTELPRAPHCTTERCRISISHNGGTIN